MSSRFAGYFLPILRSEKCEIHTVSLRFSNLDLTKKLLPNRLAELRGAALYPCQGYERGEASGATEVKIPARPVAPTPTINFKDKTLTVSTGEQYKIGDGSYANGNGNAESITDSIPTAGASVL